MDAIAIMDQKSRTKLRRRQQATAGLVRGANTALYGAAWTVVDLIRAAGWVARRTDIRFSHDRGSSYAIPVGTWTITVRDVGVVSASDAWTAPDGSAVLRFCGERVDNPRVAPWAEIALIEPTIGPQPSLAELVINGRTLSGRPPLERLFVPCAHAAGGLPVMGR